MTPNAYLPNPPSKIFLQVRVDDLFLERMQPGDIDDSLVQIDEAFDVKVLCDTGLAVGAMFWPRVDEGDDRADVVR